MSFLLAMLAGLFAVSAIDVSVDEDEDDPTGPDHAPNADDHPPVMAIGDFLAEHGRSGDNPGLGYLNPGLGPDDNPGHGGDNPGLDDDIPGLGEDAPGRQDDVSL